MKNKRKIAIASFFLLLLGFVIQTILPPTYSKIVRKGEGEFNVGEVYKIGDLIPSKFDEVSYINKTGNSSYEITNLDLMNMSEQVYVGDNDTSTSLETISEYWLVSEVLEYSYHTLVLEAYFMEDENNSEILYSTGETIYGSTSEEDWYSFCNINNVFEFYDANNQLLLREFGGESECIIPNTPEIKSLSNNWKVVGLETIPVAEAGEEYSEYINPWAANIYIIKLQRPEKKATFHIKCDKEKVQTTQELDCYFVTNNISLGENISFDLITDKFQLKEVTPSEYFNMTQEGNKIELSPKYLGIVEEELELIHFRIKATDETTTDILDNIRAENIEYQTINGLNNSYNTVKTTVSVIEQKSLVNPETRNNLIIVVLLFLTGFSIPFIIYRGLKRDS